MEKPPQHPASKPPARSRAAQMLIWVAIGLLACIAARSALALVLWLFTSSTPIGSFWSDTFPAIVLAVVVAIGSLGIYWLVRLLRNE